MDFIKLTHKVLSVEEATSLVTHPSCGAISLFIGTTRDNFEGKTVTKLAYEAYEEMAEKEMGKICAQAREKWNLKHIALHHRLGVVPVTESSVIVAVSSEHRRESLEAASYLIDSLKAKVPIWKKELYDDGSSDWKRNKECVWAAGEGEAADSSRNNNEIFTNNKRSLEGESDVGSSPPIKKVKEEIPVISETKEVSKQPGETVQNSNLVQILASKQEIQRRITAFQQRKREELDMLNIQEFCTLNGGPASQNSCARTTAVVLRSKGSSSHLKLTRVVNEWGPQTLGLDPGSIYTNVAKDTIKQDIGSSSSASSREGSMEPGLRSMKETFGDKVKNEPADHLAEAKLPTGIEERLHNLENILKIGPEMPVPKDVYARLKAVEDRVLHLEGISPEYFRNNKAMASPRKLRYVEDNKMAGDDNCLDELDVKIHELKMKLKQKQIKQEF